ncbi:hypothetical protein HDV00_003096 [Rhizophlyctis rosea]|nr:hypothetical protein HDV00_003096 [Rhizophlyctis rosea]
MAEKASADMQAALPVDKNDTQRPNLSPPQKKKKTTAGTRTNPNITDPIAHRRAKNREAQRALRDRREQHVARLQAELTALRSEVDALRMENGQLRHILGHPFSQPVPYFSPDSSFSDPFSSPPIDVSRMPSLPQAQLHPNTNQFVILPPQSCCTAGANPHQTLQANNNNHIHRRPTHQHSLSIQSMPSPPMSFSSSFSSSPPPCCDPTCTMGTLSPNFSVSSNPMSGPSTPSASPPSAPVPMIPPNSPPTRAFANSLPCLALKDKILPYAGQIDVNQLCAELHASAALVGGDPFNPKDWQIPEDLYNRFPVLKTSAIV